jgi:hypothetical protein
MFRHLFGKKPRRPDPKQLLETIIAFIQAPTWDESRRILEAHLELLSDEADQLLAQLIEAAREQNDADAEKMLAEHRDLLQRARRDGIDVAFAAKQAAAGGQPSAVGDIPAELQLLLQKIVRLTHLSDMPHKIELCQQALRQLRREENPLLWCLGMSLRATQIALSAPGIKISPMTVARSSGAG